MAQRGALRGCADAPDEAESLMATTNLNEGRVSVDRSRRGGGIGLVLLVAAVLVGAAVGLLFVGRNDAEPYILMLLAALATIGVFSLFALASGVLRIAGKENDNPLIKSLL